MYKVNPAPYCNKSYFKAILGFDLIILKLNDRLFLFRQEKLLRIKLVNECDQKSLRGTSPCII